MTTMAGASRPQPVITPQFILSMLTFLVGQAVAFGLVPEATSSKVLGAAPVVVSAAFTVFAAAHSTAAVYSAKKVTPSEDPHAVVVKPDGSTVLEPLVPISLAIPAMPNQAGVPAAAEPSDADDYADLAAVPASSVIDRMRHSAHLTHLTH